MLSCVWCGLSMRTKPLSIVCVCVCVCVYIYIHALMILKESCKCVGINVWRKPGSREKEGEQKRVVPPKPQKREFQSFRVLKFRVLEACFGFISQTSSLHHQRKEDFWGVFEYSIRAKNNTRQKRSSSRDTISFLLSLSLSLLLLLLLWLFWVQQQHQPTKGASTTSLSLLCDSMWC